MQTTDKLIGILVIEDSEDDYEFLIRGLQTELVGEIRYTRVESLFDLKNQLDKPGWDLVISDHRLPNFTSADVIELMNQNFYDIPIIVMSGAIGEEEAADLMLAGAHDFVLKSDTPTRLPSRLVPAVNRELEESRTRKVGRVESARLKTFSRAVEQSQSIIFITDPWGNLEYINPSFSKITGYTEIEVLGKKIDMLSETVACAETDWAEQIFRITVRGGTWKGEIQALGKDCQKLTFQVSITQITTVNNQQGNIVNVAEDISEIKNQVDDLTQKSYQNPVTELPNFRKLDESLDITLQSLPRNKNVAALLYLDLDNFGEVNEAMGHGSANALLRLVGEKIRQCIRSQDTVAHIHGDEFNVLLIDLEDYQDAGLVATKIIHEFEKPFEPPYSDTHISTSIGIAMIPKDGENAEIIKEKSDKALKIAKKKGKNIYKFYDSRMDTDWGMSENFLQEIENAFEYNQFILYYQSLNSLSDSVHRLRQDSFEVFLRWDHPERGMLTPNVFLPEARREGIMPRIGEWVFQQTCEQINFLKSSKLKPCQFIVNMSHPEFRDTNLINKLSNLLQKTGIDGKLLKLEIDEKTVSNNLELSIDIIGALHKLGISVTIDNFRGDQLSFSALARMPIDSIKLDPLFTNNMYTNEKLLSLIVSSAHTLDLKVIGKDIEKNEQREFMLKNHCDYAQGFYFSQPTNIVSLNRHLQA